ncbi:hypothetical protein [Cronobacter sakazakii]|uniref:hypothetical protein n=1 Tax=Cronobacter sakazakii TaxID=28141 RepID=UPI000CFA8661|nr:hypothetical protein [Cronobacter sakazakii]
MKILIGNYESGDWQSVFLGLFSDEAELEKAKKQFKSRFEGHNYYFFQEIGCKVNEHTQVVVGSNDDEDGDYDDEDEEE